MAVDLDAEKSNYAAAREQLAKQIDEMVIQAVAKCSTFGDGKIEAPALLEHFNTSGGEKIAPEILHRVDAFVRRLNVPPHIVAIAKASVIKNLYQDMAKPFAAFDAMPSEASAVYRIYKAIDDIGRKEGSLVMPSGIHPQAIRHTPINIVGNQYGTIMLDVLLRVVARAVVQVLGEMKAEQEQRPNGRG